MIKLFLITFFIAELIIASAVIIKIYAFNKRINALNKLVSESKSQIREIIAGIGELINAFRVRFKDIQVLIQRKKEEYIISAVKNALIYTSIVFLKGKYKKTVLACQLASEIYEGFKMASD